MKELNFQTRLTRWAKYNLDHSCAIEAKITKTTRLPLSHLAPHQRLALKASKRGCIAFKIPDVGLGQKPFDMFVLRQVSAYVAVMFYARGCDHFYLIDIDAWDDFATSHKSLLESDAQRIGRRCSLAPSRSANRGQ